jgi:hypothetical protein
MDIEMSLWYKIRKYLSQIREVEEERKTLWDMEGCGRGLFRRLLGGTEENNEICIVVRPWLGFKQGTFRLRVPLPGTFIFIEGQGITRANMTTGKFNIGLQCRHKMNMDLGEYVQTCN